uniref:Kelch domain containing 7A n=2 Tax=Cyprinus carpio TaxID=7962 RepID=A0A8C1CLW1_CYPCA
MPIAELLGVHFDMQLLGKLTLSVATMLFVSLVFRFYNSRAQNRRRGRERRGVQVTQTSYSACSTVQEPQCEAAKEESDRENDFQKSSVKPLQGILKNDNSALKRGQPETMDLDSCAKEEPANKSNAIEDTTEVKSGKPKLTLQLPGVTEKGPGSPSSRRSPVLMKKLEGKLDLGNCLEALTLAKKQGHTALQQAALRVMSDNYLQVLRDPGLFGRLRAGERDHIQTQRMRGRKWLVVADMDSPDWSRHLSQSTELGSESVKSSSGIYYYDDYKDTWQLYTHIPQEVLSKGCAMCTMDNYLFIAVGFQGLDREATPSKKVYCYNPMTSIWSEISPMNEARPHCKLVALQGHLYAIGGECLSTVERYDPRTNRWTFVAPLPNETFAVAHKATACNGELFVAGGTLRYTLLRYNPKTNTWRESMIMASKDKTTEMVAVRNFLYRFDVSPLGISVYRFHAVARLWYECSSIRLPHCTAFQCVTMDNIIYCVSRQFTLRFLADEVSPSFVAQDLKVLYPAKGILFPFVLVLPDRTTQQTCV